MPLSVYNTLTKKLEEFVPLKKNEVRMYNCGPTVYDHPHIGNFRAFIFADLLRRYLEYLGYTVTQVMNITDVGHLTLDDIEAGEDKIEQAARRQKKDPWEISRVYTEEFFQLRDRLNIKPANIYPKATDHIKEMLDIISKLVEKGFAYVVSGNIYFDVTKFDCYGQLSGNTLESLKAGARIKVNPEKKNPVDFALWKRDPGHVMQWDSPWGRGFPGWHIECSAMSMKYLGETFDIHTGGEDNIFPHHESEIAQSECATGQPFVRYWLHVRHLLVNGKKMSKTEGNFYTVSELIEKSFDPMAIRYLLLSAHYRTHFNFTFEALAAAKAALDRLREFKWKLLDLVKSETQKSNDALHHGGVLSATHKNLASKSKSFLDDFKSCMDDDLNISNALSCLFNYVRDVNRFIDAGGLSGSDAEMGLSILLKIDSVLGVLEKEVDQKLAERELELVRKRDEARGRRDFAAADMIRNELRSKGIILEDTKQGTKYRKVTQ